MHRVGLPQKLACATAYCRRGDRIIAVCHWEGHIENNGIDYIGFDEILIADAIGRDYGCEWSGRLEDHDLHEAELSPGLRLGPADNPPLPPHEDA